MGYPRVKFKFNLQKKLFFFKTLVFVIGLFLHNLNLYSQSPVKDIFSGIGGSNPEELINVNGTLYFSATNDGNGTELWKSDGTTSGTVMVKDIYSGGSSSSPTNLVNVNGTLFFEAQGNVGGRELWKSDGTSGGTVMVTEIVPGSGGPDPKNLTNVNGILFFNCNDGVNGRELWKSDGTASGTVMVKDIIPGLSSSNPYYLINVNNTLYFIANDGVNGEELWKSDGTSSGTVMVKDIFPGAAYSFPDFLTNVNGTLYFAAYGGANNNELWKSDGTESGTVMVKDINPGGVSNPFSLTDVNGVLFFQANDGVNGYELWKSDGTSSGTVMVMDIFPGSLNSSGPVVLTDVNGTLYFSATDGINGRELWKSDGTALGTVLVKDIKPGGAASTPFDFISYNDTLFFLCDNGINGIELWKSDGTATGTTIVSDMHPGVTSSNYGFFTTVNNSLFFIVDNDLIGFELWRYGPCITPAAPINTTLSSSLTVCGSGSTVLNANGSGTLSWYTASTGGTYLGSGTNYTTPVLTSTTTYYVQDSTCEVGTRTAITVTVNPSVAASVSILVSPSTTITSGENLTFTAMPVNGGTPDYQWKLNGVNTGSNSSLYSTSSLMDCDQVSVEMTSSLACATPIVAVSNSIKMVVYSDAICTDITIGPGGVGNNTDNELWFDANAISGLTNGQAVSQWDDRSGNGNNAVQTNNPRKPTYLTGQVNSLPSIKFDGINDCLFTGSIPDLNITDLSWFVVGKADNNSHTGFFLSNKYTTGVGASSYRAWGTYVSNSTMSLYNVAHNSGGGSYAANLQWQPGYNVITGIWDVVCNNTLSNWKNESKKGISKGVYTANPDGHIKTSFGCNTNLTNYLKGQISEVIVYSRKLNDAERIIVDNYLATKYNLSVANDIFAFESTNSYDAAGIGRAINGSRHSSGFGGMVKICSPSSLDNGDFVMWAHNNGSLTPTSVDVPAAYGTTGERLPREWRVDKTNDAGTVTVSVYLDGIATGSNLELLIDDDGIFANATQVTTGYSYDAGTGVATWENVNFTDGNYFTVGTPDGISLMPEVNPIMQRNSALDEINGVKIYPNPNNGSFTIALTESTQVIVLNVLGEIVFNEQLPEGVSNIDIEDKENGMYLVNVMKEGGIMQSIKFIVAK